jgi:hypothetical protein
MSWFSMKFSLLSAVLYHYINFQLINFLKLILFGIKIRTAFIGQLIQIIFFYVLMEASSQKY